MLRLAGRQVHALQRDMANDEPLLDLLDQIGTIRGTLQQLKWTLPSRHVPKLLANVMTTDAATDPHTAWDELSAMLRRLK